MITTKNDGPVPHPNDLRVTHLDKGSTGERSTCIVLSTMARVDCSGAARTYWVGCCTHDCRFERSAVNVSEKASFRVWSGDGTCMGSFIGQKHPPLRGSIREKRLLVFCALMRSIPGPRLSAIILSSHQSFSIMLFQPLRIIATSF